MPTCGAEWGKSAWWVLVLVGLASGNAACSCRDEGPSTRAGTHHQRRDQGTESADPAPKATARAEKPPVPKPPVKAGPCDCPAGEYCATGAETVAKGYPKLLHRCLTVPKDCTGCDCLSVDPCWEPLHCRGLRRDRHEIICDNRKHR